ncbi:Uncharacterised protein [Candidatus Norongarragalina meridionalis]|nr:Uncharacterised protein [Candidatus Norongarragalina meridionalis]
MDNKLLAASAMVQAAGWFASLLMLYVVYTEGYGRTALYFLAAEGAVVVAILAALAYVEAKRSGDAITFGLFSAGMTLVFGGLACVIAHPISSAVLGKIGYSRFNALALPGASAEYAIFQLMIAFVGVAAACGVAGFAAARPSKAKRRR